MTVVGFLNGDLTTLDIAAEDVVMQDATADSILFSPVINPAQTALQYHSKGTFSTQVGGDATLGTPTYVANGSAARYERIGNTVFISVLQAWSSLGAAAGNLICSGLPYTSANLGGSEVNLTWALEAQFGVVVNPLPSGANEIPQARIEQNSNNITILTYDTTPTGDQTLFPVASAPTGSFYINGFYEV